MPKCKITRIKYTITYKNENGEVINPTFEQKAAWAIFKVGDPIICEESVEVVDLGEFRYKNLDDLSDQLLEYSELNNIPYNELSYQKN